MKKILILLFALVLLPVTAAFAKSPKTITLKDGTRVSGQITGIDQGQYVVQSQTLGEIKVKEDDVASITDPNAPNTATQPAQQENSQANAPVDYNAKIHEVQSQIMADPEVMKDITAMAQDPQIMAILSDPAIMAAAKSGNPMAVQSNPHTQELLNNPKMQELIRKIQASQPQQ